NQLFIELNTGWLHLRKGDLDAAIRVLDYAVTLSRATGIRLMFVWAAEFLGSAQALSGRVSDGLVLLEHAAAEGRAITVSFRSLLLAHLGEAYLLAGRLDDASVHARQALELHQAHKERGWRAWTLDRK